MTAIPQKPVNGRGRRSPTRTASSSRHVAPYTIEGNGLVVVINLTQRLDGERHRFDMIFNADNIFHRVLVRAFAEAVNPIRGLQSDQSRKSLRKRFSRFCRWLAKQRPDITTIEMFTSDAYREWLDHELSNPTKATRGILKDVRTVLTQVSELPAETVELMAYPIKQHLPRRNDRRAPRAASTSAYSKEVFTQATEYAEQVLGAAEARIRGSLDLLEEHTHNPFADGTFECALAGLLAEMLTGKTHNRSKTLQNVRRFPEASTLPNLKSHLLVPTRHEAQCAALLLIAQEGFNLQTVTELEVDLNRNPTRGDGYTTVLLSAYKPRRPARIRHQELAWAADGEGAPGITAQRIANICTPARQMFRAYTGKDTNRLLIFTSSSYAPQEASYERLGTNWSNSWKYGVARANRELGLPGVAGISPRRMRQTFLVRNRKPVMHTEETLNDIYLRRDPQVIAESRSGIARAINKAIEDAEATRSSMRLTDVSRLAELGLTQANLNKLIQGALDTPVGACLDYDHHPDTGRVCDSSFLTCLGCSNAIATPDHYPKLALAFEAMELARSAMAPDLWQLTMAKHYGILKRLLMENLTPLELERARHQATSRDKELIDRLFRKELTA